MANPQPDKFTRISTELLEAKMKYRISGEENQIWEVIIRQTYGFHKSSDYISLSQFCLKTNLTLWFNILCKRTIHNYRPRTNCR